MIKVQGCNNPSLRWADLNAITQRLAKEDATIWGSAAQQEASIRLGWVALPESSRDLLPELDSLSAWSREIGHRHFILCGMGGSSLAPEVIAGTYKKALTVLDSTDPHQILRARDCDLASTCIIISSKSGSTIETASQKAFFMKALADEGLDPVRHMVVITDPNSPLDQNSRNEGLRVINANPNVGGRFSALSAFGLVPAALIGVDVSLLLDDASEAAEEFITKDSTVVRVADYLARFRFVRFSDAGSPFKGLSDWIEQLIAESTGKNGVGVLPIVTTSISKQKHPQVTFADGGDLVVEGSLGAQFIFWEWVTALLGFILNVDPFNQPNVTESKERTLKILQEWEVLDAVSPTYADNDFEIYADFNATSPIEFLTHFFAGAAEVNYIALFAYLDRIGESEFSFIRDVVERSYSRPTTFGWGPRYLHSTGQFHKGGPHIGHFLQITAASDRSLPIPHQPFGFEKLVMAQALGDGEALHTRELPFMRIHVKNRNDGVKKLTRIFHELKRG